MSKRFTSTVAGASILLTSVGLLSRGLGLVRESLFANYFGLSKDYDIYLVSVVLPMTINTIIVFLAQNFFIPIYHKKKNDSDVAETDFFNYSFLLFITFGFLIFIVLYLISSWFLNFYVSSGLDKQTFDLSVTIFKIYILSIPINAAFSIMAAYFQAEYNFIYPSVSVLILNITVIVMTALLTNVLNILVIPYAYLLGIFLQFVFLFVKGKIKIKLDLKDISLRLKEYFNSVKSSFLLIILIEAVGQAYLISDRYFFNQVDSGGIAALNYGMILFNLPISIFSVAFATALFPSLSSQISVNNKKELENKARQYFCISSFLFVPLAYTFFFGGLDIIKLIFERGKFNPSDSVMTFEVLKVYSIGLVFYAGYSIINKLFYASQLIRYLFFLSVAGLALKILLNFFLVIPFSQYGLALSTSITYIFFFIAGSVLVFSLLRLKANSFFYKELLINGINVIISALITYLLFQIIGKIIHIYLAEIAIFLIVYLFNSFVIKHNAVLIFRDVSKRII